MKDPYLYDDCQVLRNTLGIKDADLLDKAEVDLSCNAINDLLTSSIQGDYDFDHLCGFHKRIFIDVYDWAGKPRTVPMEKQEAVLGYMSIKYAHPKDILSESTAILNRLRGVEWGSLSLDNQAVILSDNMAQLWKVHPYREGNTRTIVTFFCHFAWNRGIPLDSELFEKNAAYLRSALVAATAVFPDGDFRKPDYLRGIVKDSLIRGKESNDRMEPAFAIDN